MGGKKNIKVYYTKKSWLKEFNAKSLGPGAKLAT